MADRAQRHTRHRWHAGTVGLLAALTMVGLAGPAAARTDAPQSGIASGGRRSAFVLPGACP